MKTFRSWERGEHRREWDGLTLLHGFDPDLAPQPLGREELDGRPAVVMSRIPGTPLGGRPLTQAQVAAAAEAMNRLHTAVPEGGLDRLPSRLWGVADAVKGLRDGYGPSLPGGVEPVVSRAVEEARCWLACEEPDRLVRDAGRHRVFAQADGNLGNYLWGLFATFWLYRLLPGNRGHHRNPPGSVERQAERTLALLA